MTPEKNSRIFQLWREQLGRLQRMVRKYSLYTWHSVRALFSHLGFPLLGAEHHPFQAVKWSSSCTPLLRYLQVRGRDYGKVTGRKENDESKIKENHNKRKSDRREKQRRENFVDIKRNEPVAKLSLPSWPTSHLNICFLSCIIKYSPGMQCGHYPCSPDQNFNGKDQTTWGGDGRWTVHCFGFFPYKLKESQQ